MSKKYAKYIQNKTRERITRIDDAIANGIAQKDACTNEGTTLERYLAAKDRLANLHTKKKVMVHTKRAPSPVEVYALPEPLALPFPKQNDGVSIRVSGDPSSVARLLKMIGAANA